MARLLEILMLIAVLSCARAALAEDDCQTKDAPLLTKCTEDRCTGMRGIHRTRCERGCTRRSEARVRNCQADARRPAPSAPEAPRATSRARRRQSHVARAR